MKRLARIPTFLFLMIFFQLSFVDLLAQNIAVNNTAAPPAASAVLDVDATNKGLLIPRLTATQRNAIASPAIGLFIYNISANDLEYWNGSSWIQLATTSFAATNPSGTGTGRSIAISATNSTADPSAILDIQSNTGGLLLPRMTTAQRNAIATPVEGLLVFNINSGLLDYYSSGWIELCGTSISSTTGAVTTSSNIGINTPAPDPSAMLDVSSTSAGLAIPRLTSSQRDVILSPAQGLILFNTTSQSINVYDGAGHWLIVASQANLSAPTAGIHLPSQTQIIWNWNSVTGATGYKWNTVNNYTTATDNGNALSYTQASLSCNTNDTLFIWAYNSCGNSGVTILTQSTFACNSPCGGDTTMTDARDNRVYSIVSIGTQCWMAQNLDYGVAITATAVSVQVAGQKYCYNNDTANCTTNGFGGMYEWAAMMNGSAGCNGVDSLHPECTTPVQGICPTGWHIPSHFEYTLLERNVGVSPGDFPYDTSTTSVWLGTDEALNLRSTSFGGPAPSWVPGGGAVAGTDSSGFNALMTMTEVAGTFPALGSISAYYWTSTDYNTTTAWTRSLWHNFGGVRRSRDNETNGYSVRCVKD